MYEICTYKRIFKTLMDSRTWESISENQVWLTNDVIIPLFFTDDHTLIVTCHVLTYPPLRLRESTPPCNLTTIPTHLKIQKGLVEHKSLKMCHLHKCVSNTCASSASACGLPLSLLSRLCMALWEKARGRGNWPCPSPPPRSDTLTMPGPTPLSSIPIDTDGGSEIEEFDMYFMYSQCNN